MRNKETVDLSQSKAATCLHHWTCISDFLTNGGQSLSSITCNNRTVLFAKQGTMKSFLVVVFNHVLLLREISSKVVKKNEQEKWEMNFKSMILKLRLSDVSCSFCFVTLLRCCHAWLPNTVPGPCCYFWVQNMDVT